MMIQPSRNPGAVDDSVRLPGGNQMSFFEQVFRARGVSVDDATVVSTDEYRLLGDGSIRASIAATLPERLEAADLVRERYEWRGYVTKSIKADALDASHLATTLIARQRGLVIGTMTLGFDSPSGLWIDHTYPEELARARARGRTVCELTRLAVTPNSDSRKVLSSLFALAFQVGRVERAVTDLFIEVNPRHVPVYKRLFGFVAASDVRVCGRVKAPAVLLHLDVEALDASVARYAGQAMAEVAAREHRGNARPLPIGDKALKVA